ncbi:hypothetical protein HBI56_239290 [Parastagonospora nodorum]|nr:hypothetical protein HBI56_239290 [Parastagonospora nodorum]
MCAKDNLIRQKSLLLISTQTQLAEELATVESVTAKDSNYVNTFSLDFAFSLLDRVIVVLIIILRLTPSTLLARFIPTTKIRNPLLKTLENAAKSRILLAYKHYNFNIHVSLATDTLHLLLKDLTSTEQKAIIQQLIAVVSLLFILKAPFALHFIRAVYNLHALTHIIQDIRIYRALDSIYTRANSKAYYITIVKQFYSITNKKDKRHNDPKHCNKKLYLILTIINYTCYDKDRKYIAYIRAFSKILQAFKFYNLSTIIRLVHLVLRDLPNLTTHTTISYYVNNYIN